VARVEGTKCPRCWLYRTDGGRDARFPELCARCTDVLAGAGALPAAS